MLKYSQVLMSARDGRTHPYALSQRELRQLSTDIFEKYKIHLDTNINNVHTFALVFNNTISFLFDVPIVQDDKTFNFYSITQIPSFSGNDTYLPEIDATNIAISKHGDKYTTLTPTEFAKCMASPPVCTSHRPIAPMTNQALCVIATYITGKLQCPLRKIATKPEPFLFFQDTHLFYSVPFNTSVYIKCHKDANSYQELNTQLNGIGQATYRPSCTINLPDGTSYKTPNDKIVYTLSDWPLFHIKSNLPHDVQTKIELENKNTDTVQLKSVEVDTDGLLDTITSFTTKDVTLSVISMLTPIAILSVLAFCFWPKYKQWISKTVKIAEPDTEPDDDFKFANKWFFEKDTTMPMAMARPTFRSISPEIQTTKI